MPRKTTAATGPIKFIETVLKDLPTIRAIREGRKDRLVFDTECPGLGVRLTANGTPMFIVQWTDPATKRKSGDPIGLWGSITVQQARRCGEGSPGRCCEREQSEGRAPAGARESRTRPR